MYNLKNINFTCSYVLPTCYSKIYKELLTCYTVLPSFFKEKYIHYYIYTSTSKYHIKCLLILFKSDSSPW